MVAIKGCKNNYREQDIELYFCGISFRPLLAHPEGDRLLLRDYYEHIANCPPCRLNYEKLKREASSDSNWSDIMKPDNFRILLDNEQDLQRICDEK